MELMSPFAYMFRSFAARVMAQRFECANSLASKCLRCESVSHLSLPVGEPFAANGSEGQYRGVLATRNVPLSLLTE